MRILYSEQDNSLIKYRFVNEVVYIKENENVYKINLGNLPNGKSLEIIADSILGAEKINGNLNVLLIEGIEEDFDISNFEELNIGWKSQEEIDYEIYLESLKPSDDEVKKAQIELLMLELLIDMEVM